jgi:hypothetical protein
MHFFLNLAGLILPGVVVGQHFGVLAGLAASGALYVLQPWAPRR